MCVCVISNIDICGTHFILCTWHEVECLLVAMPSAAAVQHCGGQRAHRKAAAREGPSEASLHNHSLEQDSRQVHQRRCCEESTVPGAW